MSILLLTVLPLILLHFLWARRWPSLFRFQLLLDLVLVAAIGAAWLPGVDLNPVRCLRGAPPFDHYEWSRSTHLQPAQGDLTLQMHPWWDEVRQRLLKRGELAWLSERNGAGTPLLANGQIGLFAPPMLPVWILGPEAGTTVMAVWKLELSGLGMFLFLSRVWRLRSMAASVAGLVAAAGPFMVGWLLVPLSWNLTALPWLTWLLHRASARRASWWLRSGGVFACLGLVGSGLHPESALVVVGGATLTVVICRPRGALRLVLMLALAAVATVAVTLPSLAAIAVSSKAAAYAEANPNAQPIPAKLRLAVAEQALVPAAHGHPGLGRWQAPYPYPAGALGIGGAALALVLAARVRRRHWRLVVAALACLAVPAVLLFRIGLVGGLLVHLPPLDRMTLPRFGALVPWGLALLAAVAMDALERSPERRLVLAWLVPVAGGIVAVLALPAGGVDRALVALSVGAALAVCTLVRLGRPQFAGMVVAVELAVLAVGVNPWAAHSDRVPELPVLDRLVAATVAQPGRVVGVNGALRANVAGRYGLRDLRAFDPVRPLPLARLHAVLGAEDPVLPGPMRRAPPRLLGAWSVRYLVAREGWSAPPGWLPVDAGSGIAVWSNRFWQPEVRVVGEVVHREDHELMVELAGDPVWLTSAVAVAPGAALSVAASATELTMDGPAGAHRIRATVSCDGPCLLSAARAWSPGWTAAVDDAPARLLRTNLAGIGVVVPAGQHTAELRYRPYWGAARWFATAPSAHGLLLSTPAPDVTGAEGVGS